MRTIILILAIILSVNSFSQRFDNVEIKDTFDIMLMKRCRKLMHEEIYKTQEIWKNEKIILDTLGVDSLFIRSYNNGVIGNVAPYKNGVLHGYCEVYYSNGQLETRNKYINGILGGYSIRYDPCGNVDKEGYYKNNKREGYWYAYFYGEYSEKTYYRNDKQVDDRSYFWDNKRKKWIRIEDWDDRKR
ncbi:MAG: hypothetical protein WC984_00515 [Bacteroidales bacterium]